MAQHSAQQARRTYADGMIMGTIIGTMITTVAAIMIVMASVNMM